MTERKHQAQLEELAQLTAMGEVLLDDGLHTFDSLLAALGGGVDLDNVVFYFGYENSDPMEVAQTLRAKRDEFLYLIEQGYDLASTKLLSARGQNEDTY
jgi:hypothetical protein